MYTTKHLEDVQPKEFIIKRNGRTRKVMKPMTASHFFTMAQAEQMLDQLQEELSIIGGDYDWSIIRNWDDDDPSRKYFFIATWHGKRWYEGWGETPKKALLASYTFRRVASAMGWLKTHIDNFSRPELA